MVRCWRVIVLGLIALAMLTAAVEHYVRALDFASRTVPVVARIDALQMAPSVPSNLGLFQGVRKRFMIDVAFDVPLVEHGVIARAEVGRNRFEGRIRSVTG